MIDALSKAFFGTLAGSRGLQRLASRYGMRSDTSFARRFVAGETMADAIAAAQAIEARGLTQADATRPRPRPRAVRDQPARHPRPRAR